MDNISLESSSLFFTAAILSRIQSLPICLIIRAASRYSSLFQGCIYWNKIHRYFSTMNQINIVNLVERVIQLMLHCRVCSTMEFRKIPFSRYGLQFQRTGEILAKSNLKNATEPWQRFVCTSCSECLSKGAGMHEINIVGISSLVHNMMLAPALG